MPNIVKFIVNALRDADSVPAILQAEIGNVLPKAHHAVLSIWHDELPDGRDLLFIAGDKETAHYQRLRAQVNLQIFPRSIVFLERHRRAIETASGQKSIIDVVIGDQPDGVKWSQRNDRYKLRLAKPLWDGLVPDEILTTTYKHTLTQLEESVSLGNPLPSWHLTVDAGRSLRQELEDQLRFQRRYFIDKLSDVNSRAPLLLAASTLTPPDDICELRGRHFPQVSSEVWKNFRQKKLWLAIDFEIIEDFVSFLQGLRCYAADCQCFRSQLFVKDPRRAIALLAAYPTADRITHSRLDLGQVLDQIITEFIDVMRRTTNPGRAIDDPYLKALDSALSASGGNGKGTLTKWCNDLSKDLIGKGALKAPADLFPLARASFAMAARLAREHGVHEGRQLDYSFVMGSSAYLWPEVEETLSEETLTNQKVGDPAKLDAADLVGAHWSIFQFERVFGFIELRTALDIGVPVIGKVVKIRPPVNWSGLYSQMAQHVAQHAGPCFVIHARGTGKVVLYYWAKDANGSSAVKALIWDTQRNVIDIEESRVDLIVKAILNVVGNGGKRFEEVLRSAIEEVSEARGEGAMLVVVPEGQENHLKKKVDASVRDMDGQEQKMAWRDQKRPEWLDRTLLRAMLILDGATVLYGKKQIKPRVVVYPHINCSTCETTHAFSVIDLESRESSNCLGLTPANLKRLIEGARRALAGKGSKHHGAANLSVLLFKENGEGSDGFQVVTISADGPIRQWPQHILEEKRSL